MTYLRLTYAISLVIQLTSSAFAQTSSYNPERLYPVKQLKADLAFVKEQLTRSHPALYRYTSKPALDALIDSIGQTLVRPLKEQEFLSLLSLLNGRIRDGHTMLLPGETATDYNHTRGRFLPFSLTDSAGHLFVIENNSADDLIQPGDEIMRINDTPTPAVLQSLLARRIADGYNETYPVWQLDHYFMSYYSFAFGQPARFELGLKKRNGEQYTRQILALTRDSIKYNRQSRYPAHVRLSAAERGITLKESREKRTAILTIRSFDPEILRTQYTQGFEPSLDSIFFQLQQHQTQQLILDLRDNQGGEFGPGRYLLSLLSLRNCQFLEEGKEARLIHPKSGHYTGKLTVLVNGGSFSGTAIVCASLKRDKRAIFIGNEMRGNQYIISGAPEEYVLPHTKIRYYISTVNFRLVKGANNGHGLVPAHLIPPSIEDLLQGRDAAMELALELSVTSPAGQKRL